METSETRDGTHCPCTDRQVFLYFLKYIHNLFIFILVAPGLYCCTRTFSSCNRQGLLFQCTGFSLQWLLLLQSTGSRTWAQQLWCTGLEAPRGRTCVPCVHRQVPIHYARREVQDSWFWTHFIPWGSIVKINLVLDSQLGNQVLCLKLHKSNFPGLLWPQV